jgi:hypothetical protein
MVRQSFTVIAPVRIRKTGEALWKLWTTQMSSVYYSQLSILSSRHNFFQYYFFSQENEIFYVQNHKTNNSRVSFQDTLSHYGLSGTFQALLFRGCVFRADTFFLYLIRACCNVAQLFTEPLIVSRSQYSKVAHYNITHLRRQSFYALPQSHWQLLADPPFSYLDTLVLVDEAIDKNAELAMAIYKSGLEGFGLSEGPKGSPHNGKWC